MVTTEEDGTVIFTDKEWEMVAQAVDEINERYGLTPKGKPMTQPHESNAVNLDAAKMDLPLTVRFYTDGDTTEAQLVEDGDAENYLAKGIAKRRKGDRRDPELGRYLALARALHGLADSYMAMAEEKLR